MKFANLVSDDKHLKNIGEDMQIFAIEHLYKYMNIDYRDVIRISMTQLRNYDGEKVILPWNFPFFGKFSISSQIVPVYLSISILSGSVKDCLDLAHYTPIGCRDQHSYNELTRYNIGAYLNGCLTAALPLRKTTGHEQKVFLVDIPQELYKYIPKELLENSEKVTHIHFNRHLNEDFSRNLYNQYINEAKLIITSRLHCAVPCLAAGIPVIFACNKKSFRYTWVEKYIPIYEENNFAEINWKPEPVYYEDFKLKLLECAAKRIWSAYNNYHNISYIHENYYNKYNENYEIESLENVKTYIRCYWSINGTEKYIIWGVTQTAELVYEYIGSNYPNAKLLAVIDNYHSQRFHNIETTSMDILKQDTDITVIVTAESANKIAEDKCSRLGINKLILCWMR